MASSLLTFGAAFLRRHVNLLCLASVGLLATGCVSVSVKHYVDPGLAKASYADLTPVTPPQTVQLIYAFQNDKVVNAAATANTRAIVIETLRQSRLFADVVVAPAQAERQLTITINNFPVTKDAVSKGVMAGATFGAAGSVVTDGYAFTSTYNAPGQDEVNHAYRHAMHTTVGNTDAPAGLAPVAIDEAVRQIVSGLTLSMLKDMSRAGELK
jgi:hypothetical protein